MENEVWSCDFCGKEFASEEEAVLHEKVCLYTGKKWKCFNCSRSFKNEYYQLKHSISCMRVEDGVSDSSLPLVSYLYKALASSYHPDKTNNQPLKRIYHSIMIEVNDAYKKKDLKLLKEIYKAL